MPYRLCYETPKQVCNFVSRLTGFEFENSAAIGVRKDGLLVAGMVYHNWSKEWETIELSGAATDKRWMTRPVIHGLLAYPFSFCQMVLAQHDVSNPVRAIWHRIGADEVIIPRLHGKETDGAIATLTREQWMAGRWYNGRKVKQGSGAS